jgi:hypothetical protein
MLETREEIVEQVRSCSEGCFGDIPNLDKVLIKILFPLHISPFGDSPRSICTRFFDSLYRTCRFAVFSINKAKQCTETPICDDPIIYYVSNFIGQINTILDLAALIVNEVLELKLEYKQCRLNSKSFIGEIESAGSHAQISALLKNARDEWIERFYHLRNLAIHRNGLKWIGSVDPETNLARHEIMAGGLLNSKEEADIVANIIEAAGENTLCARTTKEQSYFTSVRDGGRFLLQTIDPIAFCEEYWKKNADFLNDLLSELENDIIAFMGGKQKVSE